MDLTADFTLLSESPSLTLSNSLAKPHQITMRLGINGIHIQQILHIPCDLLQLRLQRLFIHNNHTHRYYLDITSVGSSRQVR